MIRYQDFIDGIIISRGRFGLPRDTYKERHHIIPKCMGGTNEESNLIDLTAREHFDAHKLLYEEQKDTEFGPKLATALFFTITQATEEGRVKLTEDEIGYIKECRAKEQSARMKGKPKSHSHRKHISEAKKGYKHRPESIQKMKDNRKPKFGEDNPMYGVHRYGKDAPNYGRHFYNNGIECHTFYDNEVPDGYVRGMLHYNLKNPVPTSENFSKHAKGKHWYTNGIETILAFECPEGFHAGRAGWKWSKNR